MEDLFPCFLRLGSDLSLTAPSEQSKGLYASRFAPETHTILGLLCGDIKYARLLAVQVDSYRAT